MTHSIDQIEEDEVARLLRKTDYEQIRFGVQSAIDQYRAGSIGIYELGMQSLKVVEDCNWTVEEVRAYEREHGIVWNTYF